MRRTLPVTITMTVGLIVMFRDIFDIPEVAAWVTKYIAMGNTLSSNAASALGFITLTRLHFRRVSGKRTGWQYSLSLLVCAVAMLTMGLVFERGQNSPIYQFFYQNIPIRAGEMVFAMLAYFVASSAYRAFRIRNTEATLLLASAVLVMLGSVTIGNAIWSGFPTVKFWIMDILNTSSIRALGFGITLGSLSQAARNLFDIERGYMSD